MMKSSIQKKNQVVQLRFNEHKLAKDNPRMRDVDLIDIRKALTYIMNLVGIKGEQVPSVEQKQIITEFLQSEMGRFTCEQLIMGFRTMVSGKISKIEHYGVFNATYITDVLRAYDVYLAREKILLEKDQPEQEPTQEEKDEIHNDFIDKLIGDFKGCLSDSGYNLNDDMNIIYKFITDHSLYQPTAKLRNDVYDQERAKVLKQGKGDLDRDKWRDFDLFMEGSKDQTNRFHQKVIGNAKRVLLKQWVMDCIEIGYDFDVELNSIKR